jgi:hypothetical protein
LQQPLQFGILPDRARNGSSAFRARKCLAAV